MPSTTSSTSSPRHGSAHLDGDSVPEDSHMNEPDLFTQVFNNRIENARSQARQIVSTFKGDVKTMTRILERMAKANPTDTAEPDDEEFSGLLSSEYGLSISDGKHLWKAATASVEAALSRDEPSERVIPFSIVLSDSNMCNAEADAVINADANRVTEAEECVNISEMNKKASIYARASCWARAQRGMEVICRARNDRCTDENQKVDYDSLKRDESYWTQDGRNFVRFSGPGWRIIVPVKDKVASSVVEAA